MKVKKGLAEMHDSTVQLISLVTAGASGAPFKRMKSEDSEGDNDVFETQKTKSIEDQPRLIALAVTKGGDVAAAREAAKGAEIEILEEREVTSEDGDKTTLLITKADTRVNTVDPSQIQVQLSESLIAICQVEKSFIPWVGSTSFAEAIKAQGFFPQLHNALEVMGGVTFQILEEASSPSVAATEIAKSGEDFVSLLTSMAKALPKETFKMAKQLAKKTEPTEGDETTVVDGTESLEADAEGTDTLVEKKTETEETAEKDGGEEMVEGKDQKEEIAEKDGDAEAKAKDEKPETEESTEETETEEVTKPSELSLVLKAIETLTETVTAQGVAQAALKEQVEAVALKADEAAETATETESAVRGRVSGTPAPDGRPRSSTAVKDGDPPLQDTGLASLRKR